MKIVRYESLDIFRGATVAFMILVNNQGSMSSIFTPLQHATWNGCTPADFVFPFFLFAVGNTLFFAAEKFSNNFTNFWRKIVKRSVLLFVIGLLLNWVPFVKWDNQHLLFKHFSDLRIMGVLQRIGLSYFFASIIIYYSPKRNLVKICATILVLYWLFVLLFGEIGDPYSMHGFIGTKIDMLLFGKCHLYKGEGIPFDPEGLFSTINSIVQLIIGYMVGNFIHKNSKEYATITKLFLYGIFLMFLGYCWNYIFPINKKIWTSSYVLYTSGIAILVLSILIYFVDYKNKIGIWSKLLIVFGKNSLFIFVLSVFLPKIIGLFRWPLGIDIVTQKQTFETPLTWFYNKICVPISPSLEAASLLYSIIIILFYWSIVYFLDKKKIYIKV